MSLLKDINESVISAPGKDPEVLVKGVGSYKLSSLEKNVQGKLKDLAEKASQAKGAKAWANVSWMIKHDAMGEMIKTIMAAHKELEGGEKVTEGHVTTPGRAKELAHKLLTQLEKYGKKLPEVYKDVNDYLYDMYPDLPWDPVGTEIALKELIAHPKMKEVNALWLQNHKFDMLKELKKSLVDTQKEMKG